MDERDLRTLRLFDLETREAVMVTCHCGWIAEYANGMVQREYRVPSDTLVYDLQYRLRCKHCGAREGFKIAIQDRSFVGTSSHLPPQRVVVEPQK